MILRANRGYFLTQSATTVSIDERRFETTVLIGEGENPADWKEIPASEKEAMTFVDMGSIDAATLDKVDALIANIAENINAADTPMAAEDAIAKKSYFPKFEDCIGKELPIGYRLQYEDTLYEVIQTHTVQADWTPDTAVSLFKVVQVEADGTEDNPIQWQVGMELENGKYYVDADVLYLCIRSSEQAMHFALADLVSGGYVEVV